MRFRFFKNLLLFFFLFNCSLFESDANVTDETDAGDSRIHATGETNTDDSQAEVVNITYNPYKLDYFIKSETKVFSINTVINSVELCHQIKSTDLAIKVALETTLIDNNAINQYCPKSYKNRQKAYTCKTKNDVYENQYFIYSDSLDDKDLYHYQQVCKKEDGIFEIFDKDLNKIVLNPYDETKAIFLSKKFNLYTRNNIQYKDIQSHETLKSLTLSRDITQINFLPNGVRFLIGDKNGDIVLIKDFRVS